MQNIDLTEKMQKIIKHEIVFVYKNFERNLKVWGYWNWKK